MAQGALEGKVAVITGSGAGMVPNGYCFGASAPIMTPQQPRAGDGRLRCSAKGQRGQRAAAALLLAG